MTGSQTQCSIIFYYATKEVHIMNDLSAVRPFAAVLELYHLPA